MRDVFAIRFGTFSQLTQCQAQLFTDLTDALTAVVVTLAILGSPGWFGIVIRDDWSRLLFSKRQQSIEAIR